MEKKAPLRNEKPNLFSEKAYFLIKEMILNSDILPKDTLTELKLAAILGMSRTPIREALIKLETEGIITSYGKKGYFINLPTMKEIKDMYEIRMLLEGGAARLAAKKIDFEKLEYFKKGFIFAKNELCYKGKGKGIRNKAISNPNDLGKEYEVAKLGREFHCFIIESTENKELLQLVKNIYSKLDLARIYSYQKRKREGHDEHIRIVNALKERNGEKSQFLIEQHLNNAFKMLTKIL